MAVYLINGSTGAVRTTLMNPTTITQGAENTATAETTFYNAGLIVGGFTATAGDLLCIEYGINGNNGSPSTPWTILSTDCKMYDCGTTAITTDKASTSDAQSFVTMPFTLAFMGPTTDLSTWQPPSDDGSIIRQWQARTTKWWNTIRGTIPTSEPGYAFVLNDPNKALPSPLAGYDPNVQIPRSQWVFAARQSSIIEQKFTWSGGPSFFIEDIYKLQPWQLLPVEYPRNASQLVRSQQVLATAPTWFDPTPLAIFAALPIPPVDAWAQYQVQTPGRTAYRPFRPDDADIAAVVFDDAQQTAAGITELAPWKHEWQLPVWSAWRRPQPYTPEIHQELPAAQLFLKQFPFFYLTPDLPTRRAPIARYQDNWAASDPVLVNAQSVPPYQDVQQTQPVLKARRQLASVHESPVLVVAAQVVENNHAYDAPSAPLPGRQPRVAQHFTGWWPAGDPILVTIQAVPPFAAPGLPGKRERASVPLQEPALLPIAPLPLTEANHAYEAQVAPVPRSAYRRPPAEGGAVRVPTFLVEVMEDVYQVWNVQQSLPVHFVGPRPQAQQAAELSRTAPAQIPPMDPWDVSPALPMRPRRPFAAGETSGKIVPVLQDVSVAQGWSMPVAPLPLVRPYRPHGQPETIATLEAALDVQILRFDVPPVVPMVRRPVVLPPLVAQPVLPADRATELLEVWCAPTQVPLQRGRPIQQPQQVTLEGTVPAQVPPMIPFDVAAVYGPRRLPSPRQPADAPTKLNPRLDDVPQFESWVAPAAAYPPRLLSGRPGTQADHPGTHQFLLLPFDRASSQVWQVPAQITMPWRRPVAIVPQQQADGAMHPPWQSARVIVVAGPYATIQVQTFTAGAVQGQLVVQ
jgi:hypothetical protein